MSAESDLNVSGFVPVVDGADSELQATCMSPDSSNQAAAPEQTTVSFLHVKSLLLEMSASGWKDESVCAVS